MTDSLSRLIGLPFALILIVAFTTGGLDTFGIKTILVLMALVSLMLLYIFNKQIDIWWWKRRSPTLERPLKSWIRAHSKFYNNLPVNQKEIFEKRIAAFNRIKNFTLKGKRDYQLEEDIKTIISHEFIRLTLHRDEFHFDDFHQFVVYNHPFGSPEIEKLHTLELFRKDGVVIFSKEQMINGFLDNTRYVNIALLGAIITFTDLYPRLNYPEVKSLELEDIASNHEIQLASIFDVLGTAWINKLDLLIFAYFTFPEKTQLKYPEEFESLESIFST